MFVYHFKHIYIYIYLCIYIKIILHPSLEINKDKMEIVMQVSTLSYCLSLDIRNMEVKHQQLDNRQINTYVGTVS
jgi:hypothetical protein